MIRDCTLICIITIIILFCISFILIYERFNGKIRTLQTLRTFGGYGEGDIKEKVLNVKYNNDVLMNANKYNPDDVARNIVHELLPNSFAPEIKFEQDGLFNEKLDEDVKLNYELPLTASFRPDSVCYFKDINDENNKWCFIFEFDEDNEFHSSNKNINYVKKQINYHKMILNNKPDNEKFIIVRITYRTRFNPDQLCLIIEYITKFHQTIATTILPSGGYVLYKMDEGKMKFITKEMLMDEFHEDVEINHLENSKVNKLYNNEKIEEKMTTITLDEIERKVPPKLVPYQSTTMQISFPIHHSFTEKTDMEIQTEKMEGKGLTTETINSRCIKILNYLREYNILDHVYHATSLREFDYPSEDGDMLRSTMPEVTKTRLSLIFHAYNRISCDYYYNEEEFSEAFDDILYNYILNKDKPFINRVIILNSYIFTIIQLYENWACRSPDDPENLPNERDELNRTSHLYDLYKVYELIDKYEKLIMPELVYRVKHPERLMTWDIILKNCRNNLIKFKPMLDVVYEPTIENSNGFV